MNKIILSIVSLMMTTQVFAQSSPPTPWTVTRLTWTSQDEDNFSNFVQAIGETQCNTVEKCLRSSANPYRYSDPANANFWSDCADWPYFLRSYFAWKNGLPFAYTAAVGMMPSDNPKEDERTSVEGNFPKSRYAMNTGAKTVDFLTEVNKMQNRVSSATLRIPPDYDGDILGDFYSPDIRPVAIRPGTVIYDANGHVYVIYSVKPDGRIFTFDAHPGSTITYGTFGLTNERSRPNQGAGFKNFRPMRVFNGQIQTMPNQNIHDYSLTQYYGSTPNFSNWKKGTFSFRGRQVDFYEYVRLSMATSKINPVQELDANLKNLCADFGVRRSSVEAATAAGIHKQPHPATITANIFTSEGDWENYSTPARDARLRQGFLGIQKTLNDRYRAYMAGDFTDIQYDGNNLKRDLLLTFHNANLSCPIAYTNSNGQVVSLSLELAINRLYRMSFDPYNCPERRWGAVSAEENFPCQDDSVKTAWYNGEQNIRNYLQRDWIAPKAISVNDLINLGTGYAAAIDVRGWLNSLPERGH